MWVSPGHRAYRMKEEVGAVDDLGDRSTDPLPAEGNESGESRRDFLKKAGLR